MPSTTAKSCLFISFLTEQRRNISSITATTNNGLHVLHIYLQPKAACFSSHGAAAQHPTILQQPPQRSTRATYDICKAKSGFVLSCVSRSGRTPEDACRPAAGPWPALGEPSRNVSWDLCRWRGSGRTTPRSRSPA